MPKRKATTDDIDLLKDDILELYLKQDQPLKQVMAAMAAQGFNRPKSQYESAFKRWSVYKNIHEHEWKYIVRRLHDREANQKQSIVRVRDMSVSKQKISKQRKVYEYETRFDHLHSTFHPQPRPPTPVGVEIFTPVASPKPDSDAERTPSNWNLETMSSVWVQWTPWKVLQDYTQSLSYVIPEVVLITLPNEPNRLWYSRHFTESSLGHSVKSSVFSRLQNFLPNTHTTAGLDRYNQQLATRKGSTNEQFLMFLVGMISNNVGTKHFAPTIVELARNPEFRVLLQGLLARNLDTIRALGEKLLRFAVIHNNLALVKLLVESHVDINLQSNACGGYVRTSALECAVRHGNLHIVEYLLKQGAKPKSDLLKIARGAGCPGVFRCLLDHARQMRGDWPQASSVAMSKSDCSGFCGTSDLYDAIYLGYEASVRSLIDGGVNVHHVCTKSTIQVAATRGNPRIVSMLLLAGVNVDSVGSSIPLTALHLAIKHGNIEIAEMLFDAGASLSSKATDTLSDYLWEQLWMSIIDHARGCFLRKLVADWNGRLRHPLPPACIERCITKLGSDVLEEFVNWGIVPSKADAYLHALFWAMLKSNACMVGNILALFIAEPAAFSRGHATVALVHATRKEDFNIVQPLLHAGADPFEKVSQTCAKSLGLFVTKDTSAFIETIQKSTYKIFQSYLEYRGPILFDDRPTAQQEQICEAYVFALCSGRPNLNRLLLCHGVTDSAISHVMGLDYLNEKLQTGLVLRIEERDYKAAGRLLQLGVTPVDYKNKSREGKHTILQLLARDDEVYLFKKFLGLGEDIHVPPAARNGATALQYAAINGNFSIANMCLEAGADVNAAPGDYEGRTAIEGAAEWGRLDMVRYLLEAGAMIQGRTNMNYRRTVYRAWENGHLALVGMIQVWKREQYGEDDCEDPEVIVQVMTKDELVYASEEARLRYLSKE